MAEEVAAAGGRDVVMPAAIAPAPIIVAGMHRSGTTLLARLLAAAGVFMGRSLTTNFESAYFQQINRDVLDMLGCSWAAIDELPAPPVLLTKYEILKKIVGDRLTRSLAEEHFGAEAPPVWGWKDPRNCLMLPFWQRFFPDARVVFIYRDPRDVAASLIARAEHAYQKGSRFDSAEARRRFRRYVDLWSDYNARALEGLPLFPVSVTIRYEDLVSEPASRMATLTTALGIEPSSALDEAVAQVRPERAWAFETTADDRLAGLTVESELFAAWYGRGRQPAGVVAANLSDGCRQS